MFVGAICHDLDHRGFNNKFMIDNSLQIQGGFNSIKNKNNQNLDMSMDLIASRIRTEHHRQQNVTANVSTT